MFGYFDAQDGCRIRWAFWACGRRPGKGGLVLLNGRGEFMEKHLETVSDLNRRGYDVFSLDWRGQGRSCRLLADREKGYVRSYNDYLQDLQEFLALVVGPRSERPPIVLAHSMGAHIALRSMREHPGSFSRAVLASPLIDLLPNRVLRSLALGMTRMALLTGRKWAYAFSGPYGQSDRSFSGNRLTSDRARFENDRRIVSENPGLGLGGVTYGWLAATFDSIKALHRPGYPEGVQAPVLIVAAGADRIVSVRAQKRLTRRMPQAVFVPLAGARHEILRESDPIRNRFWELFDRFVRPAEEGSLTLPG